MICCCFFFCLSFLIYNTVITFSSRRIKRFTINNITLNQHFFFFFLYFFTVFLCTSALMGAGDENEFNVFAQRQVPGSIRSSKVPEEPKITAVTPFSNKVGRS